MFFFYQIWFTKVLGIHKLESLSKVQNALLHRISTTSMMHFISHNSLEATPLSTSNLAKVIDELDPNHAPVEEGQQNLPRCWSLQFKKQWVDQMITENQSHFVQHPFFSQHPQVLRYCFVSKINDLEAELAYYPEDLKSLSPRFVTHFLLEFKKVQTTT